MTVRLLNLIEFLCFNILFHIVILLNVQHHFPNCATFVTFCIFYDWIHMVMDRFAIKRHIKTKQTVDGHGQMVISCHSGWVRFYTNSHLSDFSLCLFHYILNLNAAPMFDHDTMKVKASVTEMAINITSR